MGPNSAPEGCPTTPNFRNESSPASAGLFFFGGLYLICVAAIMWPTQAFANSGTRRRQHEPHHRFVCRSRRIDRYLDGRRGRGWLRTRLVLQWATVRADGRAHVPARLRAAHSIGVTM